MTAHVRRLIRQLADSDPVARQAAQQALQQLGSSIVPELLAALSDPTPAQARQSLVDTLIALDDERVVPALRAWLTADDEDLRALAAVGLHNLDAEDAIQACLATINDAPDPLHADVTPSVRALAERGLAALPAVLPLLESPDARTRQHAQKVLELVTFHEIVRLNPERALSDAARIQWQALWEEQGSYAWDAPRERRERAVERWKAWIDQRMSAESQDKASQ
ncbi:MAG: HEAT repeat domain-containing protein [Nitrospirae bacterium]|nr:MAG: HEAT repeat domain-containing protein [Nitrospirota bacterium]